MSTHAAGHDSHETSVTRRWFLGASAAVAGGAIVGAPATSGGQARASVQVAGELAIRPRAAWASGLAPTGALEEENRAEVLFLLVHHTASGNDYAPDGVVDLLRGFFRFHTGTERGFPDIAYNFLVDRFGAVWEGRTGSLDAPVKPSATGGTQGFAQLGCYIGDHSTDPPTAEARASMLELLAWLADTYAVDTAAGARVSFVSRGSSRWPAGATVTTPTIAGHRDMSLTTCPGDAAYADLVANYAVDVTSLRSGVPTPSVAPASPAPMSPAASEPVPTTSAPQGVVATAAPSASTASVTPTGSRSSAVVSPPVHADRSDDDADLGSWAAVAAGAAAVAAGSVVALRRGATHRPAAGDARREAR